MGDSYLKISSKTKDCTFPAAAYEKLRDAIRELHHNVKPKENTDLWHDLSLAIRGNKKSIPNYGGKAILICACHGHKISADISMMLKGSFLYHIARWIYWHLHLDRIFTSKKISNIHILEAGYSHQTQKNILAWRQYKPDLETVDAEATHVGIFRNKKMIPQYVRFIRSLLSPK